MLDNKTLEKYKYGKGIKEYYNKPNAYNINWNEIKNRDNVIMARNGAEYIISYFEDFKNDLFIDDMNEIRKSLAKFELCLCKTIQLNDNDFDFTVEEFDELIQQLNNYKERYLKLDMRRMCQD